MNIDPIAMCCISMDLSQRALQNNKKLLPDFKSVFKNFAKKQKILAKNRKIFKITAKSEY